MALISVFTSVDARRTLLRSNQELENAPVRGGNGLPLPPGYLLPPGPVRGGDGLPPPSTIVAPAGPCPAGHVRAYVQVSELSSAHQRAMQGLSFFFYFFLFII